MNCLLYALLFSHLHSGDPAVGAVAFDLPPRPCEECALERDSVNRYEEYGNIRVVCWPETASSIPPSSPPASPFTCVDLDINADGVLNARDMNHWLGLGEAIRANEVSGRMGEAC